MKETTPGVLKGEDAAKAREEIAKQIEEDTKRREENAARLESVRKSEEVVEDKYQYPDVDEEDSSKK